MISLIELLEARTDAQRKAMFARIRKSAGSSVQAKNVKVVAEPMASYPRRLFKVTGSRRSSIHVEAPAKTPVKDLQTRGSDLRRLVAAIVRTSRMKGPKAGELEHLAAGAAMGGRRASGSFTRGLRTAPGYRSPAPYHSSATVRVK